MFYLFGCSLTLVNELTHFFHDTGRSGLGLITTTSQQINIHIENDTEYQPNDGTLTIKET